MARKLTMAQHHRRWGLWTAAVMFVGAVAVMVVAFAKVGQIDPHPWGYIALIIAVFAALAALVLAFVMAGIESGGD